MKKILSLILIFIFALVLSSCTGVSEDISWEITDGTLTITGSASIGSFCSGFDGNERNYEARGDVETPWQNESFHTVVFGSDISEISEHSFAESKDLEKVIIEGENVRIEHCAFYGCENLKEIENFDMVEKIEDYAFYGCSSLTSVTLGDKLSSIERDAFKDCTGLQEVHITANCVAEMEKLYDGCFAFFDGCTSLEKFTVEENNSRYASYEDVLFTADMTKLLKYPAGKKDDTFVIPEGVTEISSEAFCGNELIKTLVFTGETMPTIGTNAFLMCASLETIIIPTDIENFNPDDFYDGITIVRR